MNRRAAPAVFRPMFESPTTSPRNPGSEPRQSAVRRSARRVVIAVVLVQVVLPLVLFGCRSSLMFFPADTPHASMALDRANGDGVVTELVSATRGDGRGLVGYDSRPEGARADGPVVLFFHGNAGNVGNRAPWLRGFTGAVGCRVVLASYSGYGGNDGSPSPDAVETDALAWFDHLVASGVPASKIVLYGRSIGGGPALAVAAQRDAAGVITQSTFSSLRSMAWRHYGWLPLVPWLAGSDFRNDERAAAMDEPLVIVHGTADRVVPFAEADLLSAAVPSARLVRVPGAGHDDLDSVAGALLVREVRAAIASWTR